MPCTCPCWMAVRSVLLRFLKLLPGFPSGEKEFPFVELLLTTCFDFCCLQNAVAVYGEVLVQDTFTVWDPRQLIKKGRERRLFLFEMALVFSKEVKDSTGKSKYLYKFKMMVRMLLNVLGVYVFANGP